MMRRGSITRSPDHKRFYHRDRDAGGFFDYTTVFVGDTMQTALVSYGEAGGEYFETWVFTFDSTYRWTLYNETEQGRTRAMGGDFVRRDAPAPRHR
jgi:hypothetical protein